MSCDKLKDDKLLFPDCDRLDFCTQLSCIFKLYSYHTDLRLLISTCTEYLEREGMETKVELFIKEGI